jgi:hypothetical protein
MPRRSPPTRLSSLAVVLLLCAAPVFAAGTPRTSKPLEITRVLSRLWGAVVQRLPFVTPQASAAETDRGADLDPWG